MTSKLKCPVCQQDLGIILCDTDDLVCDKCRMCGTENLWTTLIQAKQDLDFFIKEQVRSATALIERTKELDKCQKDLKIVVDALKPFADRDNWDFEHCFVDNPQLLAGTALEQIEHKE